MRPGRQPWPVWILLVAAIIVLPQPLVAQDGSWGGSVRTYLFQHSDAGRIAGQERDRSQSATLRLTGETRVQDGWRLVGHGVLSARAPPLGDAAGLTDAEGPAFLPLERDFVTRRGATLRGEVDRLYLQGHVGPVRVVGGRQAITWGTNYFWPALDLFAPFRPFQVDREYKPGVDALRLTLPLGDFSEVEAIGAVLGDSLDRDAAGAMLARFHLGRADVGLMAGRFRDDTVLGGFLTADLAGAGWRAELTRTRSGEPADAARDRRAFWRGSLGFDRLLTPVWSLTLELAWNGFGVDEPARYPEVAAADRVRRGEVNALGRRHAGLSLEWEFHPLWRLGNALLVNIDDPSALWLPSLRWSTGDDTEVLFGARVPLGPDADRDGLPRSEYGLAPTTLFAGFIGYF